MNFFLHLKEFEFQTAEPAAKFFVVTNHLVDNLKWIGTIFRVNHPHY